MKHIEDDFKTISSDGELYAADTQADYWLSMQCVCMCVCVLRKDRITIQEKEREQQKLKDQEHEAKRIANERRLQTLKVQLNCDKLLVKLLVD